MTKAKTQKQSAKATLAEVIMEMAKPKVAMSAREQSGRAAGVLNDRVFRYVGLRERIKTGASGNAPTMLTLNE